MDGTLYLALDIVYKGSKVSKVAAKELFEFGLDNGVDQLVVGFILYPIAADNVQ